MSINNFLLKRKCKEVEKISDDESYLDLNVKQEAK